ncbi:MAG: MOSC domain-containing protein [Bacteroidetes bacterium]|nr:MOSC domain-containing protein [Bacteroidota bacterium]
MKVLSVNTGSPQKFTWEGKEIYTSIFKSPVKSISKVSFLNVEGDEQSDLRVHGGVDKAVYSYDHSYYEAWKKEIKRDSWEFGLFGENLTTSGLTDDSVLIGNVYQIGSVKLRAVQPRFPCFKLNIRFGEDDILNRFYDLGLFGTYFRVEEEGYLNSGDEIILTHKSDVNLSISDIVHCKKSKGEDQNKLKLILENEFIPGSLKDSLRLYLK